MSKSLSPAASDTFRIVILCAVMVATFTVGSGALARPLAAKKKNVKLVVDYGDGVQKQFNALRWKKGMTVLDVMNAAKKHKRGVKFTYRGKAETGFLTEIDGLKNNGKDNWIYRVNKKLADKSFCVQKVEPGDTVLWRFGKYE